MQAVISSATITHKNDFLTEDIGFAEISSPIIGGEFGDVVASFPIRQIVCAGMINWQRTDFGKADVFGQEIIVMGDRGT